MSGINKHEQDLFAETEITVSQWQKLGIDFGVKPSDETADIEQLLAVSATLFAGNQKLLSSVANWLCRYYRTVCKHRLTKIVKDISCPEPLNVLKNLLNFVKQEAQTEHFNLAIKACRNCNQGLAKIDKADYANIKEPGIVMRDNPDLYYRTIFSGGLKASVIVSLIHSTEAGISEAVLAKSCGAARIIEIPGCFFPTHICRYFRNSRKNANKIIRPPAKQAQQTRQPNAD